MVEKTRDSRSRVLNPQKRSSGNETGAITSILTLKNRRNLFSLYELSRRTRKALLKWNKRPEARLNPYPSLR